MSAGVYDNQSTYPFPLARCAAPLNSQRSPVAFGVTLPCSLASFATVCATGAWLIRPRSRGDGETEFAGLRPARLLEFVMTGAAFFCVNICILPTGCRAKPCSVWAKPTTNFSPSPRERGRGLRGKGAHCPVSLTHVFKLMSLPSGEGKRLPFDAMPQLFVKSLFLRSSLLRRAGTETCS